MDLPRPQRDPDQDLLESLQQAKNPIRAFRRLEEKYRLRLLRLFESWRFSHEDCEELIQDTLMRVHQNVGSFRQDAKFSTWIYRIAKNLAKNKKRHLSTLSRSAEEVTIESTPREEPSPATVSEPPDTKLDPEAETLRREQEAELKKAIQKLPPRNRQCFLLWMRGHKLKDIARVLQVQEGTVKAQVHQAKQRLAEHLKNLR